MGSARKLGQSPMPSQQVLVFIAGIIHGKPVLDVSLTSMHKLLSHTMPDQGERERKAPAFFATFKQ